MDLIKGKEYIYKLDGKGTSFFIVEYVCPSVYEGMGQFIKTKRGSLGDYRMIESEYREGPKQCKLENILAEYYGESPQQIVHKYPEYFI